MSGGTALWVVFGVILLLAVGVFWSLPFDDPADARSDEPDSSRVEPRLEPKPLTSPGAVTSAFDSDAEVVDLSRTQQLVVRRARSMLGDLVPSTMAKGVLAPEVVALAGDRMEADWRRVLNIRSEFQIAARARAQEVLDAGGYREWEARRIRVPDPYAPGRMVERLSTPHDGQREDEFILAIAATESGRRLRHVVRLVPESDVPYARLFAKKQRREEAVRDELLTWLDANLR